VVAVQLHSSPTSACAVLLIGRALTPWLSRRRGKSSRALLTTNVSRMNRHRREVLMAAALLGFVPLVRAADKSAESAIYRALFTYFESKATEPSHVFVAEKAARLEEVLPEHPSETLRPKRLQALVPGTTESVRNEFLRVLESRRPIDARNLAFEGRIKVTVVSRNEPEDVFNSWGNFRERFPDAKALLRLSHVAIDDDKQTALVCAGYWCGGTCGGGYLFLLANLKNGWRVVHDQMLWVA
jgi:hypothetical protein